MSLKRTMREATKDDIGTEVYVHDLGSVANSVEKMAELGIKRKLVGFKGSGIPVCQYDHEPHILCEWGHARVIETEVIPHKPGDWVKITKPASGSGVKCPICNILWNKKMDKFDGAVVQIPLDAYGHLDGTGKVNGFNAHWPTPDGRKEYWAFAFAWMEPAEPPAPKFKAGDWVKITKPKNLTELPEWVLPVMDPFNGKVMKIRELTSPNKHALFDGTIFSFNQKWLTPAEEPKPKYRLADDRDIGKYVTVSNQAMTDEELDERLVLVREYLGKFNDSYLCRCGAADVQCFNFAYIKAE